jgi:hypothetical protein
MGSDTREKVPMNKTGQNSTGLRSATSNRMTVDEARKVPWLRSRPRPLGELLNEGYLDRPRLEWAAKTADDPRLKEAAQVILDWQSGGTRAPAGIAKEQSRTPKAKTPIRVGISLEEARSTVWPFGALRGQSMGTLCDTRRLSLKDLVYAVERAWDDRVRRAAIALMLVRLDQELEELPQQAGTPRVVAAPRSYAERRQLSLAFLEGSICGAGLAVALAYLVYWLTRERPSTGARLRLSEVSASPELMLALLVSLLGVAGVLFLAQFAFDRLIKGLDQQIEAYRKGEEGEERVVEKARQALDDNWTVFRNVILPGRRRADLDIVLVGPPGVWALEVKTLCGEYRNVGEAWQYRAGSQWRRMTKSPSRQARDGAIALKDFLRADGITTFVPAIVAWAGQGAQVSVQDPTVQVWTLDRLEDELGNLWNGRPLSEVDRKRIVEKLTRVCLARKNGQW